MKIGIEVELNSEDYSLYDILSNEGLSFTVFKQIHPEFGVKMSEEYYSSTMEYNITPIEYSKKRLNIVKKFLNIQRDKYSLSLNSRAPAYVGTHIHFFNKRLISSNKPRLLKKILSFIVEHIDDLSDNSLRRLCMGHQLWTYWSHTHNHSWFKIMGEYGIDVDYYDNNSSKKKYSPIIISPQSPSGKPRSLEIRIIPNEFMFNNKIDLLLKEISNDTIYNRKNINVEKFIKVVLNKLGYASMTEFRIRQVEMARQRQIEERQGQVEIVRQGQARERQRQVEVNVNYTNFTFKGVPINEIILPGSEILFKYIDFNVFDATLFNNEQLSFILEMLKVLPVGSFHNSDYVLSAIYSELNN